MSVVAKRCRKSYTLTLAVLDGSLTSSYNFKNSVLSQVDL